MLRQLIIFENIAVSFYLHFGICDKSDKQWNWNKTSVLRFKRQVLSAILLGSECSVRENMQPNDIVFFERAAKNRILKKVRDDNAAH